MEPRPEQAYFAPGACVAARWTCAAICRSCTARPVTSVIVIARRLEGEPSRVMSSLADPLGSGTLVQQARSVVDAVTSEPAVGLTRGRTFALHMRYTRRVRFSYELEQEDDGRWLVEIMELPGCMAYGSSAEDALRAAQVLAFRILADRLEHHEQAAVPDILFVQAA